MMKPTNAELAAEQIRKHGVDRYPTVQRQLLKLVDEVGELVKALNHECIYDAHMPAIRREAVDVALSLYNLTDKLGIDLDTSIYNLVKGDTRKF